MTVTEVFNSKQYGPRALPTPNKKGVLHIYHSKISELICDTIECGFVDRPHQFAIGDRDRWFQAMYIPEEYVTCSP